MTPGPCAPGLVPVGAAFGVALCTRTADGRTARVVPNGALCSGDPVWLTLRSAKPAYVYLVQEQRDLAQRLWPREMEGIPPLGARMERRVPAEQTMTMDHHPGPMNLYIVASVLPLEQADEGLYRRIQKLENWGPTTLPDKGSEPLPVPTSDWVKPDARGIQLDGPGPSPGPDVLGYGFEDGMAVAVFSFDHSGPVGSHPN